VGVHPLDEPLEHHEYVWARRGVSGLSVSYPSGASDQATKRPSDQAICATEYWAWACREHREFREHLGPRNTLGGFVAALHSRGRPDTSGWIVMGMQNPSGYSR
jgi:hypothetical protein